MEITFCHIIGIAALFSGFEAIKNKKVIISFMVGVGVDSSSHMHDDYPEGFELSGLIAIVLGLGLIAVGVGYLFFEADCAVFFKL